ncbi:hypothetical protein PUR57_12840 [Streptomyces sp. JV176]|uniref:hypothetical protein n=1 Tax=Streptomyces sp. JV176 TaxID=858630 RepID=UPI002E79EB86|nr:hypothetical protein [Streptomyces sp. JV176]MEE1799548.1 hypothetical protein [Streptomyces sp. JV176]
MASEFTRRNVLRTAAVSTGTAVVSGRSWGGSPAVAATPLAGHTDPGGDAAGPLDRLDFGAPDSETAHALRTGPPEITEGQAGDRARVARPLDPPTLKGGDLTFTMAVDPVHQNYLTVKFWGGDTSGYKTIAYINGEQIGYRRSGDYEALNPGTVKPLPGRFHFATVMLPLESTRGQERAEITLRTYDAGFSAPVTAASRGYHAAYTHTGAYLDVSGEQLGDFRPTIDTVPDLDAAGKQGLVDGFTAAQVTLFDDCSAKVDASANGRLSLVRYEDELRFYSSALATASWCPAWSAAERKAALARVFKAVDNHTKDYYAHTMLLARGGHQGDWGGFYGALNVR